MVSLERQSWIEFAARHTLLLILVGTGYVVFDYIVPLFWFAAYAATSFLSILLLDWLSRRNSFSTYLQILSVFTLRIVLFRMFLLYLWFQPLPQLQLPALCMLLASVRFSINQKTRIRSYTVIQAAGDVITIAIISGYYFALPWSSVNLIGGLSFAAFAIYYLITLQQAYVGLAEIEAMERRSAQSQKMEALGRLTGGVAHDFNNILTAVLGNLELTKVVDDPKEKEQLVDDAHQAAQRASLLTAQLLAFSRQAPLKQQTVQTKQFLDRFRATATGVLPPEIDLEYEIQTGIWPMWVDPALLEMALLSLVQNGKDAMPGGGKLVLRAQNVSQTNDEGDPRPRVSLSLTDTGKGMSDELLDRVFEPFYSTKPVGEGSGLGLSMVKGFSEQSKGEVTLESKPGAGTTVTLGIPARIE